MDGKITTINLGKIQNTNSKRNLKKILVIAFSIIMITGLIGAMYITNNQRSLSNVIEQESRQGTLNTKANNDSITPTPEPIYRNPFNGIELTKEELQKLDKRPLAIMMDNSQPARQVQENLSRADIVYEAIVEGGWTRFMPIYYSDQSDLRVMPVRSVRMVFLDNFVEYNDILLYHVGGAETPGEPKTNAIDRVLKEKIKSIYFYQHKHFPILNEKYDDACFKKIGIGYSCKYHMTSTLRQKAQEAGFENEPWEKDKEFIWSWQFDEDSTQSEKVANKVTYKMAGSPGYDAEWTFDETTKTYKRKSAKREQTDHAAKKQIAVSTVIVQKIPYKMNVDSKQRVISDSLGTGNAYIFMNGKAHEVIWKKECDTCRTRYYTKEDGDKEFTFAPGKIWVSVTKDTDTVVYE